MATKKATSPAKATKATKRLKKPKKLLKTLPLTIGVKGG